jgi:hypothetical protein
VARKAVLVQGTSTLAFEILEHMTITHRSSLILELEEIPALAETLIYYRAIY